MTIKLFVLLRHVGFKVVCYFVIANNCFKGTITRCLLSSTKHSLNLTISAFKGLYDCKLPLPTWNCFCYTIYYDTKLSPKDVTHEINLHVIIYSTTQQSHLYSNDKCLHHIRQYNFSLCIYLIVKMLNISTSLAQSLLCNPVRILF